MKNRIKNRIHKNHAAALLAAAFTLGAATAFGAIDIEMVTVGNINNAADTTTGSLYGSVSYEYQIGKYEVTNVQYVAFLNAVAGTDTYSLYNTDMGSNADFGGITRTTGDSGSYEYAVKEGWGNKPVNHVSFYDAARFVNWLQTGSTETGLYTFEDGVLKSTPDHATSTGWVIASEDEWYKAAYYNPTLNGGAGGYTNYPFVGGGSPTHGQHDATGANYYESANGGFAKPGGEIIADVDYYVNAASYFGTYGQGGNLWEWNDSLYDSDSHVLRGGSFYNLGDDPLSAASGRISFGPAYEGISIGFRVAYLTSVPEPSVWGSAMGLTMLVIGMWVRRGRRPL
ncbi:MAG: SUMF1/EgtB/PvdO family nonheme iron enzyme [Opitutaceae bacterium]|jgi:formylglycine-generating enzyme required for sulfatase activity|nr:SUMF1/EgtB/PvdO family nonheme iron enzyme [Opitutaceae bacterium]